MYATELDFSTSGNTQTHTYTHISTLHLIQNTAKHSVNTHRIHTH